MDLIDIRNTLKHLSIDLPGFGKNHDHIYSRLDYFLVSFGLVGYVENSEIISEYKSDHSMIKIKLKTETNRRGPGFGKLNCSLLENEKYIKQIKNVIRETIEYNPNTDPPPPLLWDTV